jgi:hypothetical protein
MREIRFWHVALMLLGVSLFAAGSCIRPTAFDGDGAEYAARRDADVARCLRFCQQETARIIWYADGGQECACIGGEALDR